MPSKWSSSTLLAGVLSVSQQGSNMLAEKSDAELEAELAATQQRKVLHPFFGEQKLEVQTSTKSV